MNEGASVVVTGVAPVSSVGIGRESFWQGLMSSRCGIREIISFDTSGLRSHQAAEVSGFRVEDYIQSEKTYLDRSSAFTLAGCSLALQDAQLTVDEATADRIGICLGTAYGCQDSMLIFWERILQRGAKFANSLIFTHMFLNSPISLAAIEFNLKGFHSTYSSSLLSGLEAISHAALAVWSEKADAIIAGGVEAFSKLSFLANYHAGHLAPRRENGEEVLRPFDKLGEGWILGEGAGLTVLENKSKAKERGAQPLAEVAGIGMAAFSSQQGWKQPAPTAQVDAIARSMKMALDGAGIRAEEVDLVAASAHSVPEVDGAEAQAIAQLFKDRQPLVTSIKGAVGETVAAGGALSFIVGVLSLTCGEIPPVLNLKEPVFDLPYVREPHRRSLHTVLINAVDADLGVVTICVRRPSGG